MASAFAAGIARKLYLRLKPVLLAEAFFAAAGADFFPETAFFRVVFEPWGALAPARSRPVGFPDFFVRVRDLFGAPLFAPDFDRFNPTTFAFTAATADRAVDLVPEETSDLPCAERFPIIVPAIAPATAPTGPATAPPMTAPATPPAVCFETGSWGFAFLAGARFFILVGSYGAADWL